MHRYLLCIQQLFKSPNILIHLTVILFRLNYFRQFFYLFIGTVKLFASIICTDWTEWGTDNQILRIIK